MGKRPGDHAQGQPARAEAAQRRGAGNQSELIQRRGQGRGEKGLVRLQNAHQQPAQAEDDGPDQHDAHELGRQPLGLRGETGGHDVGRQGVGEKRCDRRHAPHRQHRKQGNPAGQGPGRARVVVGQAGREGGDEGRTQRAASQQAEQQVGDLKRRPEGVVLGSGAVLLGDQDAGQEPGQVAQDIRPADNEGGPG